MADERFRMGPTEEEHIAFLNDTAAEIADVLGVDEAVGHELVMHARILGEEINIHNRIEEEGQR